MEEGKGIDGVQEVDDESEEECALSGRLGMWTREKETSGIERSASRKR